MEQLNSILVSRRGIAADINSISSSSSSSSSGGGGGGGDGSKLWYL